MFATALRRQEELQKMQCSCKLYEQMELEATDRAISADLNKGSSIHLRLPGQLDNVIHGSTSPSDLNESGKMGKEMKRHICIVPVLKYV